MPPRHFAVVCGHLFAVGVTVLLSGPSLVPLIRFLGLLLLDLVSRYSLSGLYRDPWSAQIK